MRDSWRRAAAAAGLAATSLGLSLGAAELFVRSDWARTRVLGAIGTYDHFPERLRPTLNSLGYRDEEHADEKPAGTVRILVLGDSLTFGHGVADDEIWPRQLQQIAGAGVEVITLAQNGWSTTDELRAFERDGRRFDPDLVVVGVVDNDLQPPIDEPSGQQREWRVFGKISKQLDLFRWLDYALNRIGDRMGWRYTYAEWVVDTFDPAERYLARWQRTVAELGTELRRAGIDGYAFVLTSPVQPADAAVMARYRILRREFEVNGFESFNLQTAFVRDFGPAGGKPLWALPNDPHPGPRMHRFYAEQVWSVLETVIRGVIDRPNADYVGRSARRNRNSVLPSPVFMRSSARPRWAQNSTVS